MDRRQVRSSLLGPKADSDDEITKTVPYFTYRHMVKGGVTGWAQIHGRSHLTRRPEQKLRYDMYYVYHNNILLDLKILFHTIFVVLSRKEAY